MGETTWMEGLGTVVHGEGIGLAKGEGGGWRKMEVLILGPDGFSPKRGAL